MCTAKQPRVVTPEPQETQVLRNPFLDTDGSDESVRRASRSGVSSLRIPLDPIAALGFSGRGATAGASASAGNVTANARSSSGAVATSYPRYERTPPGFPVAPSGPGTVNPGGGTRPYNRP